MLIESLIGRLKKGQSTNSTDGSFSATNTVPTTTQPAPSATRTILSRLDSAATDAPTLIVIPYGGNDNNDVVNVKVYGWNKIVPQTNASRDLWISRFVCEVQGTLSSALLGVATEAVVATEFFCDALTLTAGDCVLHNGTADIDTAWFECDVGSFELIEIRGDLGAGGDQQNWLVMFSN